MGLRKTFLMNITVKIFGTDSFICRPDTTWERENRDFYPPEFVGGIYYTPVIFARISKAGKFIGSRFVSRYYDGLNFGILMYPEEMLGSRTPESIGFASLLDHSSILPFPLYLPEVLATEGNCFILEKDGKNLFNTDTGAADYPGLIGEMICDASRYVSQRIGDLVAVELAAPAILAGKDEKRTCISASFCGNGLFRLSIIR